MPDEPAQSTLNVKRLDTDKNIHLNHLCLVVSQARTRRGFRVARKPLAPAPILKTTRFSLLFHSKRL